MRFINDHCAPNVHSRVTQRVSGAKSCCLEAAEDKTAASDGHGEVGSVRRQVLDMNRSQAGILCALKCLFQQWRQWHQHQDNAL